MSMAVVWEMPQWLAEVADPAPEDMADAEVRMRFVLELVDRQLAAGSGGPFAAAVFDADTYQLIACGVNRAVPSCSSSAHAEIVALSRAQQRLGSFDLSAGGSRYELVSSTEPCAMCLGALPWSGIRALVCGAADADARAAGFDEGDKPIEWQAGLRARGIAVTTGVAREAAARQLARYAAAGGTIYNPGGGSG